LCCLTTDYVYKPLSSLRLIELLRRIITPTTAYPRKLIFPSRTRGPTAASRTISAPIPTSAALTKYRRQVELPRRPTSIRRHLSFSSQLGTSFGRLGLGRVRTRSLPVPYIRAPNRGTRPAG